MHYMLYNYRCSRLIEAELRYRESCQRCNVLKINDEELVTISRMFGYPGIGH